MSDILGGQFLIVACERHLAALRGGPSGTRIDSSALLGLPAEAPLPEQELGRARVLVLEVDANSEASMARLSKIRASRPDLVIIAAVEHARVALVRALVRQGVHDVAELPFQLGALEEQVLDAMSTHTDTPATGELGRTVVVVGASGGSGATSVVTHLAAALAETNPGRRGVCLLDLDLQKGGVSSYLGIEPKVTVQTLIDAGARLDRDLMASAVVESEQDFSVIAAPDVISPIDGVDIDHLLAIVALARAEYDYVLVDLPPLWTDWTLSLVRWAHRVVLVTDSSIASLRQARRTMTLLGTVDVSVDRVSLAVNRFERKLFGATRVADISRALGRDKLDHIADAGPALRSAQDQGVLLPTVQSKSRFSKDLKRLARRIVTGSGEQ